MSVPLASLELEQLSIVQGQLQPPWAVTTLTGVQQKLPQCPLASSGLLPVPPIPTTGPSLGKGHLFHLPAGVSFHPWPLTLEAPPSLLPPMPHFTLKDE